MNPDMTKHFTFHTSRISVRFLYFNLFSGSFNITFLFDGIATSINKQILCYGFNYYVWPMGHSLYYY